MSLLFPAAHDPDRHMRSGTMTRVFYPARQAAGHAAAKLTETSNARHYDVPRRNHRQARDNPSLIPICAATGADVGAHKLLPSALTATPTAAALHHEARLPLVGRWQECGCGRDGAGNLHGGPWEENLVDSDRDRGDVGRASSVRENSRMCGA